MSADQGISTGWIIEARADLGGPGPMQHSQMRPAWVPGSDAVEIPLEGGGLCLPKFCPHRRHGYSAGWCSWLCRESEGSLVCASQIHRTWVVLLGPGTGSASVQQAVGTLWRQSKGNRVNQFINKNRLLTLTLCRSPKLSNQNLFPLGGNRSEIFLQRYVGYCNLGR